MTELSPNVEVVLSSNLFNDDPCLESMSTPVIAVLDAYMVAYGWLDSPTKRDCRGVAAALRAAAIDPSEIDLPLSKVVEWEKIEGVCASYYAAAKWGYEQALAHINNLAKELENHQ